jgi:flagellar biosynthesis component FlhA
VTSLVPQPVSLRTLFEVLRSLVREGVVIRHILPMIKSVARHVEHIDSMDMVVSRVRREIPRCLSQRHVNSRGKVTFVSVDPEFTRRMFRKHSAENSSESKIADLAMCPRHLISNVRKIWNSHSDSCSVGPAIVVEEKHRLAI